jgi:hypothetical protein
MHKTTATSLLTGLALSAFLWASAHAQIIGGALTQLHKRGKHRQMNGRGQT